MIRLVSALASATLALPHAFAEGETQPAADTACHSTQAVALTGTVRDTTMALVPGATLTLDGGPSLTSGNDGRFRFPCVSAGTHRLSVKAEGFAAGELDLKLPHPGEIQLTLKPDTVQIGVEVNADEATAPDAQSTGESQTISGKQLQSLADDPDDLQRQLQQLAAASGGNPANTTISVDGFQDSSKLPPKSAIAYIKVNPDQFSAEYRQPPFDGGRIEVYTKPGQKTFHGALFATNGSPWMNARDPFSTRRAPLGKQRYGFELTGPIKKQGADFSLNLEHRSIDNFGVVNAIALDSTGNPSPVNANIATPQRLWVGQARSSWQLGPKNTFITSFDANINHLQNVGVGGTNLAETGYNDAETDNVLRFTDVTTVSPHLMHEARFSMRGIRSMDLPNSSAPGVQVAGAFTGGGATQGQYRLHELRTEFDDDAILTTGHHTLKFGVQLMSASISAQATNNFNGTYTFGGGTAPVLDSNNQPIPGETATISGIEQYRRALLGLAGGAPTAFTDVEGTPALGFTQLRDAFFIQDDWSPGHGLTVSGGLRYAFQTVPTVLDGATPRLGILWSPNKKGTWTLHAHAGMFTGQYGVGDAINMLQEDGVQRITRIAYNPTYQPNGGNFFQGTTPIESLRSFNPHMSYTLWSAENFGGTRTLPKGWNLSLDYYYGRIWNDARSININSPLNGDPNGPRALGIANLNNYQANNSGQGHVNVEFAGIEQHQIKWLQLFFGGVHVDLFDDTNDDILFSPQSAFSNAGEFARRSNQPVWQIFGNASLTFPKKIVLSSDFHGGGDIHYNITTGFDNNGDGNFNDRPQYAAPGTPGAVNTPYGLLVATGGTAVFGRNRGVMPWQYYLDTNLQRAFNLSRNPKADHPQALTVNVRSANLLNHTNVTAVGGVLGSPLFGVPYQADNGRRVEAGLRYSF